jgi:hypothetical protein
MQFLSVIPQPIYLKFNKNKSIVNYFTSVFSTWYLAETVKIESLRK